MAAAFPNRLDPPEELDGAAVIAELGANELGCCVIESIPKESEVDGGGPAGVVDVFPKVKVVGALLVGVEAPIEVALDVLPPRLLNMPPPAVFPPSVLDGWLVAGDVGC